MASPTTHGKVTRTTRMIIVQEISDTVETESSVPATSNLDVPVFSSSTASEATTTTTTTKTTTTTQDDDVTMVPEIITTTSFTAAGQKHFFVATEPKATRGDAGPSVSSDYMPEV